MTELGSIFRELGLAQYLDTFIEQGFDTWETILDITESDFDALGVKLGHRRKIQRRIANTRGHSAELGLVSPAKRHTPSDDRPPDDSRRSSWTRGGDPRDAGLYTGKRKYKRHPKPDENAPERPPSAYVIFSNKMREDLKGRNLSFTEIAKLVGENWQILSASEKEPYESQAFAAKEKYNNELAAYKKTNKYKEYAEYLAEFKAKQASLQQAAELAKRPRLEKGIGNDSSGTGGTVSSSASQCGTEVPNDRMGSGSTGLAKYGSAGESYTQPPLPGSQTSRISQSNQIKPNSRGSPSSIPNPVLPGYRDIVIGSTQQQTLAWRENVRGQEPSHLPPITNVSDRRSSQAAVPSSPRDSPSHPGLPAAQGFQSKGQGFTPPLLTSESTMSTNSNNSSTSTFYPRTPLDAPFDRCLPVPSFFSAKPSKPPPFDTSLPPFGQPSLSPQSSQRTSYNSQPSGSVAADYINSGSHRGYQPMPHLTSQKFADYGSPIGTAHIDPETLDPVTALLRASDIVNRTSQSR